MGKILKPLKRVDAVFTVCNRRLNGVVRDCRRMLTTVASARGSSRLKMLALLRNRQGNPARLVFRLPLIVYRLGLGCELGHQFLVLTHSGRRSGRVHQTARKVLHYDPLIHECIVASALGHHTDWYRNIQCRASLAVQTTNEWYVPEQRAVGADEALPFSTIGRGVNAGSRA